MLSSLHNARAHIKRLNIALDFHNFRCSIQATEKKHTHQPSNATRNAWATKLCVFSLLLLLFFVSFRFTKWTFWFIKKWNQLWWLVFVIYKLRVATQKKLINLFQVKSWYFSFWCLLKRRHYLSEYVYRCSAYLRLKELRN